MTDIPKFTCGVYRIICAGEDYIGSSFNIRKRITDHKANINCSYRQAKLYKHIRENGMTFDYEVLLECEREELKKKEKQLMKELKPSLNQLKPFRTEEEYLQQTRENATYQYYNNYELNRQKRNTKVECECGVVVSRNNLCQHKKSQKHLDNLNS